MGNRAVDRRLEELKRANEEEGLWSADDTIVVAVSGGPDSMALLHMLLAAAEEQRLTLVAAHVNHGFRPESEREAEMVGRYARDRGLAFETVRFDLPAYIEETGMNPSSASRMKRYAFLHEIAARYGAKSIALGHHADDQAETVLMRIMRGTGLAGLAAIAMKRKEKNVELIRPLLRMNKTDLLAYCADYEIPYCIDSSNEKRDYFRNAVRLDILPYLSRYNPQLSHSLRRLAEVASAEDEWMEWETVRLFEKHAAVSPSGIAVDVRDLSGFHVALQRRLIKLILNYLSGEADSASFEQIEKMRLAAAPDARTTLRLDAGGGIRFIREYDRIHFVRTAVEGTEERRGYAYSVAAGNARVWLEAWRAVISFAVEAAEGEVRPAGRYEACFDADRLSYPLVVRSRQPGDRMHILGLNGSKKVQDMFVDAKIPPSRRDGYPLLFDAEGRLLWVPGIRRSGHALVESGITANVLRVRLDHE